MLMRSGWVNDTSFYLLQARRALQNCVTFTSSCMTGYLPTPRPTEDRSSKPSSRRSWGTRPRLVRVSTCTTSRNQGTVRLLKFSYCLQWLYIAIASSPGSSPAFQCCTHGDKASKAQREQKCCRISLVTLVQMYKYCKDSRQPLFQ